MIKFITKREFNNVPKPVREFNNVPKPVREFNTVPKPVYLSSVEREKTSLP